MLTLDNLINHDINKEKSDNYYYPTKTGNQPPANPARTRRTTRSGSQAVVKRGKKTSQQVTDLIEYSAKCRPERRMGPRGGYPGKLQRNQGDPGSVCLLACPGWRWCLSSRPTQRWPTRLVLPADWDTAADIQVAVGGCNDISTAHEGARQIEVLTSGQRHRRAGLDIVQRRSTQHRSARCR